MLQFLRNLSLEANIKKNLRQYCTNLKKNVWRRLSWCWRVSKHRICRQMMAAQDPGHGQISFLRNEYSYDFPWESSMGRGRERKPMKASKGMRGRSTLASSHPAGRYLAPHVCIVEGSQHIWAQNFITSLFQKHLGTRFIFSLSMQRAVKHKRDLSRQKDHGSISQSPLSEEM